MINEIIKIKEDITWKQAKELAKIKFEEKIKREKQTRHTGIMHYIFIDGVSISDLIIVEFDFILKDFKYRQADDQEWGKYFRECLYPAEPFTIK